MKKFLFILIILTLCTISFSQIHNDNITRSTHKNNNTFFFELLGNAGIYSINYDRIMLENSNLLLAARAGFFYDLNILHNITDGILIPVELSCLFGKEKHFLEVGGGITYCYDIENNSSTFFNTYRLGYRYQKATGGLFLKIGITPLLLIKKIEGIGPGILPFAGLSMGYTFKSKH